MSTETTFYPSAANDMKYLEQSATAYTSSDSTSFANTLWRTTKFNTASFNVSGSSGATSTAAVGGSANAQNLGFGANPLVRQYIIYTGLLRFDTSSLDDTKDITGAQLGLFVPTGGKLTDYDYNISIYAGRTGASYRPTFSSPPANPADFNNYCETYAGCSSSHSCQNNEGLTGVGTIDLSAVSTNTRNNFSLDDGSYWDHSEDEFVDTSYNDWVNRTGYTYIFLIGYWWGGSDPGANSTACSYNDNLATEIPSMPGAGVTNANNTGILYITNTSGNGPTLTINQGKTQFQMVI